MLTEISPSTFSNPWKGIHSHLTSKYGKQLEKLDSQAKWRLIATLGQWQDFTREIEYYGGTPVTLAEYVGRFSTVHEDNLTVLQALQIIANDVDESTALNLIAAIVAQLQSGVFATAA